jgi:uncharacterized membrane protein
LRLALLLGALFLVVNPPYAVNDEDVHMARMYELSTGQLVTLNDGDDYHYVPGDYEALGRRYQGIFQRDGGRVRVAGILKHLGKRPPREPLTRMRARAAGYSPISYHLQVPMIWLGRQLHLGAMWHMYLARVASLTMYLFLTFRAVSVAGRLEWLFAAVALMPMALMQAAGASTDGLVIGLSLLFFAHIARNGVSPGPVPQRATLAELLLVLAVLTLSKPVYLVAGIALLTLRWEGRRARLRRAVFTAGSMLLAASLFLLWNQIRQNGPASASGGPSAPVQQLQLLLSEPWRIVQLTFGTAFRTADDLLLQSIFMRYGMSPAMRFAGGVASILYAQLLFGLSWGAARGLDPSASPPRWLKLLALGLSWLGILCAVPSALYLCCVQLGGEEIRGFHGRYLIPAFPALLLALSLLGRPVLRRWLLGRAARLPLAIIVFSNLLCLFCVVGWHYYSESVEWPF